MEGHASINSITLTTWKLEDLPTHQVFSTNEPREGRVKTTASPAAPAQRHPSRHLIEHPVQVTSKERKSRETAERDESGPESLRRGGAGSAAAGGPVKSGLRHLSSPFASLPSLAGAHTLSKKRTLTTRLLSQAPLATTSDLMQKHLHLFFKSMEEAKLPA